MSIANYLTALDAQRDQLARNLVTMGVQASESEKLNTLVPKVLQIPSGRLEVTLFHSGSDALQTYGELVYTYYVDGYRSIAGFADVYPHFCCAENDYALYYNQPDFNWGAVIYTMCITPVRITPASRILLTYKSGATDAGEMWLVRKSGQQMTNNSKEGPPLVTHTADDIKSRYTIWLAHWVDKTNYTGAYGIWQHSEKGSVDGINGNVDLDIGYKDFPMIIKAKGLNGYGKELNPPAPAAEDGITVEITVDGKKYSGKLNKA